MTESLVFIVLLIAGVVIAAGALVMTLINLGYYCNPRKGRGPAGAADDTALVSVCVPARNEEANIEACVRGVLANDWPYLEVLVYDDQSTDATPRIIERLVASDPRVRCVETRPLPDGWIGKQWACQRMGEAARGRWLLFTDADVRFEESCVRATIAAASSLDAAMISTFPRQITLTLAERLIVPMIHFILFSYLPMGQMRGGNSPSASAGCGQFLCIRRDAYEAVGGHAAWKDSMHDGIRMARAVRRAGMHSDLYDGTAHVACRMYAGLGSTWRGFAKNAYEGLGSVGLLVFLTVIHAIGHVLPWVVVIGATAHEPWQGVPLVLAGCAIALTLAQRLTLARHFRQSIVGALLHPLGIVLMTAIQWHSFVLAITGKRQWRGRGGAAAT